MQNFRRESLDYTILFKNKFLLPIEILFFRTARYARPIGKPSFQVSQTFFRARNINYYCIEESPTVKLRNLFQVYRDVRYTPILHQEGT